MNQRAMLQPEVAIGSSNKSKTNVFFAKPASRPLPAACACRFTGHHRAWMSVFRFDGKAWSQKAYVKASNTGAIDGFDGAAALSADGSTLAVGPSVRAATPPGSMVINSTILFSMLGQFICTKRSSHKRSLNGVFGST